MTPSLVRGLSRSRGGQARLRLLTGLALASAAAMLVTVVLVTDRGPDLSPRPTGDVVRVGVVDGQSVSGYLRSSKGELAGLTSPAAGETWALVSLSSYFAPDTLTGLFADTAVAEVYARAPIENVRTQVVRIPVYRMPGDVVAGMLNAALARDQEQADYRKLAAELEGDGINEMRLRRAYDTAARAAASEAAAYRAHCACLFAAVVRAGPAVLDRLASRAEVRVVDPAPEVRSLDRTEFRPVLPEAVETPPSTPDPTTPPVADESSVPLPSSTGGPVTSASPDGPAARVPPSATTPEESALAPSPPPAEPSTEAGSPDPGASQDTSWR